jgi:hypothetical protein
MTSCWKRDHLSVNCVIVHAISREVIAEARLIGFENLRFLEAALHLHLFFDFCDWFDLTPPVTTGESFHMFATPRLRSASDEALLDECDRRYGRHWWMEFNRLTPRIGSPTHVHFVPPPPGVSSITTTEPGFVVMET